jgi:hypothetical protein
VPVVGGLGVLTCEASRAFPVPRRRRRTVAVSRAAHGAYCSVNETDRVNESRLVSSRERREGRPAALCLSRRVFPCKQTVENLEKFL